MALKLFCNRMARPNNTPVPNPVCNGSSANAGQTPKYALF